MAFTDSTVFHFPNASCKNSSGLPCGDECMCRKGQPICCIWPLRFSNTLIRSGCPGSWMGYHLILFVLLSPSRDPVGWSWTDLALLDTWVPYLWKLERYSTDLVLRFCRINVLFTDMLPSLVKHCLPDVFVSMFTSCFLCSMLRQQYSVLLIPQVSGSGVLGRDSLEKALPPFIDDDDRDWLRRCRHTSWLSRQRACQSSMRL